MPSIDAGEWPATVKDHALQLSPLFEAVLQELACTPSHRSNNASARFSDCIQALGSKLARDVVRLPSGEHDHPNTEKLNLIRKISQQQLVMREMRAKISVLSRIVGNQANRAHMCVSRRSQGGEIESTLGVLIDTPKVSSPCGEDESQFVSSTRISSISPTPGPSDDEEEDLSFEEESQLGSSTDGLLLDTDSKNPSPPAKPDSETSQQQQPSFHPATSDILSNFLDIDSSSEDEEED